MHFSGPHNEIKCVFCIKESYSKGKNVKIFTFAYGQPDRKILGFFSASLTFL